jgi:hypothetical protein
MNIIFIYCILHFILILVNLSAEIINVDNINDSYGNYTNCYDNSGLCNIRSAVDLCNQLEENCEIILPINKIISFNSSIGSLIIYDNININIDGQGSSIISTGDSISSFIVASNNNIFNLNNLTITNFGTQFVEPPPTDITLCPSYSVSNTNYAEQNYASCEVYACPGSTIVISGCGPGACSGDQYLSLYDSSNYQVASNDDNCGLCSEITYITSQPCQTYSIHEGCYGSNSCGGTLSVIITSLSSNDDNYDYYNDFYYFNADDSPSNSPSPTPETSFYSTIVINKSNKFLISNIKFDSNVGADGGALIIFESYGDINNCEFFNNLAVNGGSLWLISSNISVSDSKWIDNVATNGGAIYSSLSYLTISNNGFYNNNATLNGGVLYQAASELIVRRSEFMNNMAFSFDENSDNYVGSGGVFYSNQTSNGIINNFLNSIIVYDSLISNNIAGDSGSGCYCMYKIIPIFLFHLLTYF